MNPSPGNLLLSIPFGETFQSISSPRYFWDNLHRGKDPFVILQWALAGEGAMEWEGKRHAVRAGEAFIIIIPENSQYYYPKQAREPWHVAWVNFYGPFALWLFQQLRTAFGPVIPLPARSAAGVMAQQLATLAKAHGFADPHEASAAGYAFVMEWLRQLSAPILQRGDPVQTALALCAARFREPLGVKELAAQTGLSREHFTRIFAERTGKSPARHLRDLRVAAAQQMLRRQNQPLKEVALRCGFPSVRSLRQALEARE
ncbi:MAG: helix-turn-helix domain-containing protein [Chthoniobacteraceae bacterium]|nr:helix-turn-helix domain-containing protein [Chthoniobacteraceae bacterium]